ncbi:putative hemolysin [Erwinia psidii]|uniref:DUF333 domain-containing protein n=1 Tax=Erwinia psidii TaxID=69224 RepID=A0A3N6UVP1_9GAMM|nr:DUF333 domain-containing protein [Erwinia psidii]MCX8956680.1 DUF333 domain-containing protein [Erwinia psidii]MCX8964309.1 DUF333 domain-containing protein [Erwinia psidii]RQM40009.1 DUF333 domain-containing protein [Erwinia psidii]
MKKIILMLFATAIAGCSAQIEKPAGRPKIGMSNPASEWCIKQGGRLDIVSQERGQSGYCTLPDGERVEEWMLYRRDHG